MGCTYVGSNRLGTNKLTRYRYSIDSVGSLSSSTFSFYAPARGTIIGLNVVQNSTDLTMYIMDADANKIHPSIYDMIKAAMNKYINDVGNITVPYETRDGAELLYGEVLNNAAVTTGAITFELLIA